MSEQMKNFWIGLFIIVSLILIAWLLLFLKPTIGDGKKQYRVRFSNIERVNPSTPVHYAGKAVGKVEAIHLLANARDLPTDSSGNPYLWEVVLRVDSSVSLYSSDEISSACSGLLGEKVIAILPKAPLAGSPPAHEITDEVIFADSQDRMCEIMHKVSKVADEFSTLIGKADNFFDQVKESNLVPNVASTFNHLNTITAHVAEGKGTMGQLLYNDSLYLQLSSTLGRLEWTLYDINNYGLLFHWNANWQKEHRERQ